MFQTEITVQIETGSRIKGVPLVGEAEGGGGGGGETMVVRGRVHWQTWKNWMRPGMFACVEK